MIASHLPRRLALAALVLSLFPGTLLAQGKQQPPCDAPEASQFDFWLGEWELTWPAEQWGGKAGERGRGRNTITKILDDCIVQEAFRFPAGKFDGHSVSAFSTKRNSGSRPGWTIRAVISCSRVSSTMARWNCGPNRVSARAKPSSPEWSSGTSRRTRWTGIGNAPRTAEKRGRICGTFIMSASRPISCSEIRLPAIRPQHLTCLRFVRSM